MGGNLDPQGEEVTTMHGQFGTAKKLTLISKAAGVSVQATFGVDGVFFAPGQKIPEVALSANLVIKTPPDSWVINPWARSLN